jgi:hypothetical protein
VLCLGNAVSLPSCQVRQRVPSSFVESGDPSAAEDTTVGIFETLLALHAAPPHLHAGYRFLPNRQIEGATSLRVCRCRSADLIAEDEITLYIDAISRQ